MIRCYRCQAIVATPGIQHCPPDESAACDARYLSLRSRLTTGVDQLARHITPRIEAAGPINWKYTCWDFTNRLQLLASDPALQDFADHDTGDTAAALRKLIALLREGPLGSVSNNRTGR